MGYGGVTERGLVPSQAFYALVAIITDCEFLAVQGDGVSVALLGFVAPITGKFLGAACHQCGKKYKQQEQGYKSKSFCHKISSN